MNKITLNGMQNSNSNGDPADPEPPPTLSEPGKEIWREVTAALRPKRCMHASDTMRLIPYVLFGKMLRRTLFFGGLLN